MMNLVYVWYNDRYWPKIILGTIPTPVHALKVKVTDFLCLSFTPKFFGPHYFQTL